VERGRGYACQMESWSGRQSSDEAEKDRMFVLPHSGVGCSLRLSRPDLLTHFCCGGRVTLSASGLQGRYKV